MWPHRRQPTRLPHPWDSPGKNTGVGCHFLLQCMKVKSENEVTQSCPTLSDPMDCSPPGSSVHGTFQAGVQDWGAIAFSVDWTQILHTHKVKIGKSVASICFAHSKPSIVTELKWQNQVYYFHAKNASHLFSFNSFKYLLLGTSINASSIQTLGGKSFIYSISLFLKTLVIIKIH